MPARVLHLSDLHIGRREAPEPLLALRDVVSLVAPEVVVATGDLSHRGTHAQLEHAAELLRSLGPPVLAIPGNHDIPRTVPARFTRTYAAWEAVFGTTEPVHSSEAFLVVGSSSVRPWRQQSGALPGDRLERISARLRDAAPGPVRVVAVHHHLAAPPWRARRKRPLADRDRVLQALATAGAELVVAGHVHQVGITERREFEALEDRASRPTVVLATAPGFGRPRPRRRGEARGFNVYESSPEALSVTTYAWAGTLFEEVARRSFARVPRDPG